MEYNLPHQIEMRKENKQERDLFLAGHQSLTDGRHHHVCENCCRVIGTGKGKGKDGLGYPCDAPKDHTQGCCLECHPEKGLKEISHRKGLRAQLETEEK